MTHKVLPEEVWGGLLPKKETQSFDFIQNHPDWDGRGIIVGILDTGVDPGAIGLQQTTDGKPKVIDIIDCSGSGDVTMHGPFQVDSEGTLPGIGGQRLKVNTTWNNPSGEFRVGVKRLYELYPKPLKDRMKQQRKKSWDRMQEQAEMRLQQSGASDEETSTRLSLLRSMADESIDNGPVVDCVIFHDGERWQAVVDCSGTGDMSSIEPMTDYRHKQQFRRFSDEDAFNFGVNIYDDGAILSIVTDTGAHGTHVAGIVSAYHPENPECNGVAPGAQIVSLKIGNTRLGSMETGAGLVRALIEAVKRGCNIINMSYGEATTWDNEGVFVRVAEELVYKHGITFVASAGNNGPCLSTVGAPGGTSSCIISVGAFVTQSLMRAAYSMLGTVPETNFTWSSVGPATDGDVGVTVLAPGGAITCVPNWTLNKSELMNGTSMSSPNACGCMALLQSAAKANSSSLSSARLRLAVENSAQLQSTELVDVLGQNHGLLQVENAWNHIVSNQHDSTVDIPLQVSVNSQRFKRGIYLRHASEMKTAETFQVTVQPRFHEHETADTQIQFEMRLQVKSTASWIQCPEYLLVAHAGKTMRVTVDPTRLQPGQHYVEFVRGYDERNIEKGPVFELPVTVIVPEEIAPFTQQHRLGTMTLPLTQRVRKFIVPPVGCTFVDVHVTDMRLSDGRGQEEDVDLDSPAANSTDGSAQMIVIHALQLKPGQTYSSNEKQSYLSLTPGSTHCVSFAVTAGVTLELVLTRFWSTLGDICCDVSLHFMGVVPSLRAISITSGEQISNIVTLSADLCTVTASPAGKLDKWLTTVMPSVQGVVTPLGERDVLPAGTPIYQMILEYSFEQPCNCNVTPRWTALNQILYESQFNGQFYMVYNSKKVLVACGEAYPEAAKLDKGKYTVRLQIRHESSLVLEKLNVLPMVLERALEGSNTAKLTCHRNLSDAALGVEMSPIAIFRGTSQSMFWKGPTKLPKFVGVGDVLVGSVTYLKKPQNGLGAGTMPGGFPVEYVVTTSPVPAPTKTASTPAVDEPTTDQKYSDAMRAAKVKYVDGLVGDAASFDEIYASVVAEYPDYVPLRLSHLNHLVKLSDKAAGNEEKGGLLSSIVDCADEICSLLKERSIAEELGTNADTVDPVAMKVRKQAETDRDALVQALSAKCTALADRLTMNGDGDGDDKGSEDNALFTATYARLQKWESTPTADKNWRLYVTKMYSEQKFGAALKRVNEMISKKNQSTVNGQQAATELKLLFKMQRDLLEKLNWEHILAYLVMDQKLSSLDEFLPF